MRPCISNLNNRPISRTCDPWLYWWTNVAITHLSLACGHHLVPVDNKIPSPPLGVLFSTVCQIITYLPYHIITPHTCVPDESVSNSTLRTVQACTGGEVVAAYAYVAGDLTGIMEKIFRLVTVLIWQ